MYETRFEPGTDTTPTGTIVEAIATAKGVDPIDLPPLTESIDPDALDGLFGSPGDGRSLVLGFAVDDVNVFLSGDGRVRVCDPSKRGDPTPFAESTDTATTD